MDRIRLKPVSFWVPALFVLGLAFWLRIESSQLRLFHADEGVQSYQAWRLIETGEYRYDAEEHHGPLLYYVAKWMYPLIGDVEGNLTDAGMRVVPLVFSLLAIGVGLLCFRRYGGVEALLWALLVASAPLCVIYGSYFVQEALLTCFTLCFLLGLYQYWRAPSFGGAFATGVSLGLMHVLKETAVLHALAIGVAGMLLVWMRRERWTVGLGRLVGHLGVVGLAVGILHCVFFSSFFENPRGIWDGVMAYFNYAERSQGAGHEKPLFYYFSLLWPHRREGILWGESAFLLLVLIGLGRSLREVKREGFPFFLIGSGALMLGLYSVIPYKNPWLLLTPYTLLSYAVGYGLMGLLRVRVEDWFSIHRLKLWVLVSIFCVWLGAERWDGVEKAVFRFSSSSRNPYLYMHTTPRYGKLLDRLESVKGAVDISIYSPDAAWPLPWHLRGWARVGYWQDLERYEAGGIDVIDTRLLGEDSSLFGDGGFWELHGLRPNTLLALRATEEVAEAWISKNAEDR